MKFFNLYIVALVSLIFSSCEKHLLNTVPNDRLATDLFWRTENDAKLAVNALYTDLDGTNIISWDALTDIAHTNQPFDVQAYVEQGTYDISSAKVYTEWQAGFKGISATNYFLANVSKVPSANTALINQFNGEAKTLRAYQYIKLAGLFGDVPLITNTVSIAEASALKRTPVAQVYDFIDKELTDAAALLPATYGAADKGRITKGAALALKARADLYASRYQPAADAAMQVMQSGTYALLENYQKLFLYASENNKEVILNKEFLKDSYSNNIFYLIGPYSQKNSNSTYVPTKTLVDAFETADGKSITDATSGFDPFNPYLKRDPRLRFSVYLDGDPLPSGIAFRPNPNSGTADAIGSTYIASTTGFNIKKYINTEDFANPSNSGINIILLRYAEVLLTYAEAKVELNQLDQTVYDAINAVRNKRDDVKQPSIATGQSQAALRTVVRHEREVELAFEGQRLFDIRRWKIAENVMVGPVYGLTYVNNGQLVTVQSVAFNRVFDKTRHYLWPIPQKETLLDPNLGQNPNW
jgi:hypothetical protein